MRRLVKRAFLLAVVVMSACAPQAPAVEPLMVNIHATAAAAPWLDEAFTCAADHRVVLNVVPSPDGAAVSLRLGEPPSLEGSAYQIDTEEILIAANRGSRLQSLDAVQARDLFARGQDEVQLWIYARGEDVQQAFDHLLMQGISVTSLARLASTPQEMLDTLNAEGNAAGILPRHWIAGSVRELYSVGSVPVLAIAPAEPQGAVARLIDCLQK